MEETGEVFYTEYIIFWTTDIDEQRQKYVWKCGWVDKMSYEVVLRRIKEDRQ